MHISKIGPRLALAIALAAPLPCAAAAAPPPVPVAEPKGPALVLVGAPSEILSPRTPLSRPKPVCATFSLLAAEPAKNLRLTTSGLGDARLAAGTSCPGADGARILDLAGPISLQAVSIRVTPDRSAGDYKGKIVVLQGAATVASSDFSVLQPAESAIFTAMKWAVGLIIPTIVTFLLARLALLLDTRRKESEEFRRFRSTRHSEIRDAMDAVRIELTASGIVSRGPRTWKTLLEKKILEGLPLHEHNKLAKACDAEAADSVGDTAEIRRILVRLFPHQTKSLTANSG